MNPNINLEHFHQTVVRNDRNLTEYRFKSKLSNAGNMQWYCAGCDKYHTIHQRGNMVISSNQNYRLHAAYCEKTLHAAVILGCNVCGKPADPQHMYHNVGETGDTYIHMCNICHETGVQNLQQKTQTFRCDACKNMFNKISRCARCKSAVYCSRTCQLADWSKHKPVCFSHN